MMMDLIGRQTCICLGSAFSWAQECWVWQINRLVYTCDQHLAEPKDVGSCRLLDPYMFGFSTWLSQMMLDYYPASGSFK